jgi:hypothetical protein
VDRRGVQLPIRVEWGQNRREVTTVKKTGRVRQLRLTDGTILKKQVRQRFLQEQGSQYSTVIDLAHFDARKCIAAPHASLHTNSRRRGLCHLVKPLPPTRIDLKRDC